MSILVRDEGVLKLFMKGSDKSVFSKMNKFED